jgi:putative transcriptional regulator
MIEWKLSELMARHRIKVIDLAAEMKVAPIAISNLRKKEMPRLTRDTLVSLMASLRKLSGQDISLQNLMDYKED